MMKTNVFCRWKMITCAFFQSSILFFVCRTQFCFLARWGWTWIQWIDTMTRHCGGPWSTPTSRTLSRACPQPWSMTVGKGAKIWGTEWCVEVRVIWTINIGLGSLKNSIQSCRVLEWVDPAILIHECLGLIPGPAIYFHCIFAYSSYLTTKEWK